MEFRKIGLALGALSATIGLMILAGWLVTPETPRRPAGLTAPGEITAVSVDIGGPFELVSHEGKVTTDADFRGQHLLIFFGYTYCPDVCPTALQGLSVALDELGPLAARVQPLFISVDPKRDTPEALAAYVEAFHPGILGLTGTPAQIAEVAKAYHAFYARAEEGGDEDSYLVDHSAYIYLMGPDGAYRSMFSHGTAPKDLADSIRSYLDAG